jgi:hypothetical protein
MSLNFPAEQASHSSPTAPLPNSQSTAPADPAKSRSESMRSFVRLLEPIFCRLSITGGKEGVTKKPRAVTIPAKKIKAAAIINLGSFSFGSFRNGW